MNSRVKEIAENSFDETLQGTDKLVVVEFYLPTCPHCQAVAPIYEKIARELGDAAVFTRINAQNNQRVSMEEGITVTPTFKFFCKNDEIGEMAGTTNETILRNTIKDFIKYKNECKASMTAVKYDVDGYA